MRGNNRNTLVLQPRDRKLLGELGVMRVIDRESAKVVAGFNSTTRANDRLLALTKFGYLRRSFVGTVSGGRKAVYRLSERGQALACADDGGASMFAKHSYSELFLEHQLRINLVYIAVKHEAIPLANCSFRRWVSFSSGLSKSVPIIPDGYFELKLNSHVQSFFLEVDMGTESKRVWKKKIEGYLSFAITGDFGKRFGASQFKVLVITTSKRRIEGIRQLTAKLTDKIFRFTSFETINREDFWSTIWQKPVGDQTESLL